MLLFYEFLGADPFRHHRNELFPFLLGLCRRAGVAAAWKTVGLETSPNETGRFLVDLDEERRVCLASTIRDLGVTRIIFNESIDAPLSLYLQESFGDIAYSCLGDLSFADQSRLRAAPLHLLRSLFDLPEEMIAGLDPAGSILDQVDPAYQRAPCAACGAPAFAFLRVLVGDECAYRRPLALNRFFAGMDLSSATHDRGCSFCPSEPVSPEWSFATPPLDLAFRQLDLGVEAVTGDPKLRRFHSRDGRVAFLMQGAVIFRLLEPFLERLIRSDTPPAAFLFSCRADELVARKELLRRWLPRLEPFGHAIHIWVMGVENFSEAENERLNKNLRPEQILAAERLINELEREHPDSFAFNRYGGFSFILFTPWTSIEDLRTNLAWAQKVGIDPRSFFLRSRIQLVRGTPIALLAERDGLVVDTFSEPYFDSGCIQSRHEQELSWRFLYPEVASIYSIGSRLPPELPDLLDDHLYQHIQAMLATFGRSGRDGFAVFESLLDTVEANREARDFESVIEELFERLGETSTVAGSQDSPSVVELPLTALRAVQDELEKAASALAAALKTGDGRLLGFEVVRASERRSGEKSELMLELKDSSGEPFLVTIEARIPGRHYLAAGGLFGVGHAKETPPTSRERRELLAAVARLL